jgi:hypothetical protein
METFEELQFIKDELSILALARESVRDFLLLLLVLLDGRVWRLFMVKKSLIQGALHQRFSKVCTVPTDSRHRRKQGKDPIRLTTMDIEIEDHHKSSRNIG